MLFLGNDEKRAARVGVGVGRKEVEWSELIDTVVIDLPSTFHLNLGNFCSSCLTVKFACLVDVAYMLADDTAINSKNHCQLLHCQP